MTCENCNKSWEEQEGIISTNCPFCHHVLEQEVERVAKTQVVENENISSLKSFKIDEDGLLTEYVGSDSEVLIPDSVIEIGEKAFAGCRSLKEVLIPNSVTKIGAEAFFGCRLLKEVLIPDLVTKVKPS